MDGYKLKLAQQKSNRQKLEVEMGKLASKWGENLIQCDNPVSVAMTLKHVTPDRVSELGGYLYNLRITGPRVLNSPSQAFGTCTVEMPYPYIVMNAAIGSKTDHITESVHRLEKALLQLK